jgi:hypothetical protein
MVALDIQIAKGYQLLVKLSPISLMLLAFKFHKNLSLEKRLLKGMQPLITEVVGNKIW